jgi:hypothetical protein
VVLAQRPGLSARSDAMSGVICAARREARARGSSAGAAALYRRHSTDLVASPQSVKPEGFLLRLGSERRVMPRPLGNKIGRVLGKGALCR